MMTGAQAMVKSLEKEGVSVVFGYPGATICPFYDALSQSGIRHILVRQEQNGGHAANGYARISGKPGVCIATSGPGATNLLTALATAYMDSIPLVAITGQVPTDLLGRDVFQEADITGCAEPFTKYSFLVKHADELPKVMKEAFCLASTGRPGPVLVDVPIDVQNQMIEFNYPDKAQIRGYKPTQKGHAVQVKRVASAITKSKRPLLCIGGGAFLSHAEENLRELAEGAGIPVVTTMMGLGVLPTAHPLNLGMLGTHGCRAANQALRQSDLLLIVGARVGDRAVSSGSLAPDVTIVHIDVDPAEIGKNLGTNIPLVGDAAKVTDQLAKLSPKADSGEWLAHLTGESRQKTCWNFDEATNTISPRALIELLSCSMDDDSIYVADVGQNQMWSARGVQLRRGRFLTSGGMGTMGYSIPAAIGAKLASPEKQVVAVCGDGSFQMQMMELATICQHGINIKIVVMNNRRLGLVREIQSQSYGNRQMAVDMAGSPDICRIAAAYGIPAMQIHSMAESKAAVEELLQSEGTALLECMVDPCENTGTEGAE